MTICFIADNPETTRHPVIGVVLEHLRVKHDVRLLDVQTLTGDDAIAQEDVHPPADIYLLKSHAPQALEVAHHLEQRGALVVNSHASSSACYDRLLMTQRMTEARLPWPQTWSLPPSQNLPRQREFLSTLPFPLILKSRCSYRGDLVVKVYDVEQLEALARPRNQESFILQDFVLGDGSDIKLWVVGEQVFAARRSTPLDATVAESFPLPAEILPSDWRSLALEIGRVFDLRLYGVDLLMTEDGPVVVDVNSFPGFRGVAGADSALIALIDGLVANRFSLQP
jgi:ribosomal protein S6--L-glutamate ligase